MNEEPARRVVVWDLPIRVFHLLFAAFASSALLIAATVDEHSPLFRWHMVCGLAAGFMLAVRVLLAFAGSRPNRLSGLLFAPGETARYFATAVTGVSRRYPGHNPGSALGAWLLFGAVGLLVWTGITQASESREDLHAALAWALAAGMALHLAGLALHTWKHRENIAASMVTGRRAGPPAWGLASTRPVSGFLILCASLLWTGALFRNAATQGSSVTLPLTGVTLALGEAGDRGEAGRDGEAAGESRGEHEDEEEDDD